MEALRACGKSESIIPKALSPYMLCTGAEDVNPTNEIGTEILGSSGDGSEVLGTSGIGRGRRKTLIA